MEDRGRRAAVLFSILHPPSSTAVRRLLWLPLVLAYGLLVALVAAGFAGAYLDPGPFWWAAMAAVVLPFTGAALAVAALVALGLKKRGWAAVGLGLAAAVALRAAPFGQVGAPAAGPDDLELMTFNVPRHGRSAEELAANVYGLMAEEQPDVLALQEALAWVPPHGRRRTRITGYLLPATEVLGYRVALPAAMERGGRLDEPLLIRRDGGPVVLEQAEGALPAFAGDSAASSYLRTRLRWRGREAVHYNVHLRSFGAAKPWEGGFHALRPATWRSFLRRYRAAYRHRAREVRALRARLDAEALPVIVSGDFNATPDNWAYRQLARGRTDAFRAAGSGWGGTYRSDLPLVRIDHVLVDPAFEVVAVRVPDVRFSDHRPVVARIRWRDGEAAEGDADGEIDAGRGAEAPGSP